MSHEIAQNSDSDRRLTAFDGFTKVVSGDALEVVKCVKDYVDQTPPASILIFDDQTGEVVDVDFRGEREIVIEIFRRRSELTQSTTNLIATLRQEIRNGPGRPKLGVVAREVTLLPRHWEWLSQQPGGASVALRKLVEEARKGSADKDRIRAAQDRTYKFLSAIAGDLPGYEDTLRALYATDSARFTELTSAWPTDIGEYARRAAVGALTN